MIVASQLSDVVDWFRLEDNWWGPTGIIARVQEHAEMSFAAIAAAILLAVPAAVWLGHRRKFGTLAINVSNAGRAIPSFAILVVGTQLFGLRDVPVIGSWFVFVALIVLAMPPMVTNTYVAMAEVPDEVRDAARGMGLSERQALLRAELPIAVPMVMGGIRTAAVLVVSTATIAAQVGSGGLGRFIVEGFALGPDAIDEVFAGAILVALFALATEGLFALLQRLVTPVGLRHLAPVHDLGESLEPDLREVTLAEVA
jgi:osmoprotectant transport system permease protein